MKYSHNLSSMLSEHQPWNSENRELEIGQISKIKLFSNTVDDCLQRQIAEHHFSKNSLNQKAGPVNAGHCMAFKHCKLLLRSTQNHARNSFQAFVCCHLKMLCCSVWIWADSLFSEKSSDYICCFCTRFHLEYTFLFLCNISTQELSALSLILQSKPLIVSWKNLQE